ncbi:MAG: hypothetical protein JXN65_01530 [Clostridia bacterium]|nr:hypothetical protein [Clostridia bacterium]
MNKLFVFNLTTENDYFEKGNSIFLDDGKTVGRVLKKLKVDINKSNIFYSYDIESTEEIFNLLKKGERKIYNIENYSVSSCSTYYTNK